MKLFRVYGVVVDPSSKEEEVVAEEQEEDEVCTQPCNSFTHGSRCQGRPRIMNYLVRPRSE